MPKFSDYFFWLKWIDKIIVGSLWWVIAIAIVLWLPFTRPWWWIFMPIFLAIELKKLYIWWIEWDYNYANKKWVVMEMIPPNEILTPLKAMEDIFTVLWPVLYSPPTWREIWFEGILPHAAEWMSFEIVSIEGKVHFFMRVTEGHKTAIESALYAHYPNLEINKVSDYTKNVPQNIPNEEWDVYGEDFILGKSQVYPIKTYEKFFEPQGEKISAEEKRIDPIISLLESMSKLGSGEQFWLQFIIMSVDDKDEPLFKKEGEKVIAEIAKRPQKKVVTWVDWLNILIQDLIFGPVKERVGEKATYKWREISRSEGGEREMVVTPGEREVITEVENKLKKPIFRTNIRGVYLAKRENFKLTHRTLVRSYFSHFQTQNLNYIRFSFLTRPKTQYFFRKRIPFLRSRRQFRNYVLRFTPLFPNRSRECLILNSEEMATIFHFPLKVAGSALPVMQRVESKKGGPPANLPTE